ncbi:MAG: SDR family NAD(P)-dependent oxidoreductase [Flavobacteriales bacterium]|nr:SDR family NAD(P)-dependent oxidoreductase [Flavobacteriales bacterium]
MNIIVTGCSKGIGLELVKLLAVNHKVFAISRDISVLNEMKQQNQFAENLIPISADITQINQQFFDSLINSLGIDVLINNAGFLANKPFIEFSKEDYRDMMDVNFYGVINMIQLAIEKLSNAKGQVVNIGSIGGIQGSSKFPGLSIYSSSKGALSILTECLAVELAEYGIKINCLALGAVQTDMLNNAFPGFKAEITAFEMAGYIVNFINSSSKLSNGLIIPVKKTNP